MPPHCDSLDGPVVKAAMSALDEGDVDLVLPFVKGSSETEVRAAFDRVIDVRSLSSAARDLADRYFFETVVRIHRAGEQAPYTGLKPAGLDVGPAVPACERALETDDPDEVVRLLSDVVRREVHERLGRASAIRPARGAEVRAVREYVESALGFQVWANHVYETIRSRPHGGSHEHQDVAA